MVSTLRGNDNVEIDYGTLILSCVCSLHFIDPRGPNQYQHAISSTVSILQEYDADKQFPVYGFGGIPPGAHNVDHCFPLNLNPSNPEVAGSQGVLQVRPQVRIAMVCVTYDCLLPPF